MQKIWEFKVISGYTENIRPACLKIPKQSNQHCILGALIRFFKIKEKVLNYKASFIHILAGNSVLSFFYNNNKV